MTSSERKREANRANAKRSTGPRTAEGKARSRGNAVKHGMTANVTAIPGEDQAMLDARREAWVEEIARGSSVAAELANRAFRALVKAQRVDRAADAAMGSRLRRAEELWEARRAEEVRSAIDDLQNRPLAAVARLKTTAEGIRWLKAALDPVFHDLDAGLWSADGIPRLLDLLGLDGVGSVPIFAATEAVTAARDVIRGFDDDRDYREVDADDDIFADDEFEGDWTDLKIKAIEGEETIRSIVREYVDDLDERLLRLEPASDRDREDAVALGIVDTSREGRLIERYQSAADRELHRHYRAALEAEQRAQVEAELEAESDPAPEPSVETVAEASAPLASFGAETPAAEESTERPSESELPTNARDGEESPRAVRDGRSIPEGTVNRPESASDGLERSNSA